MLHKNIKFTVEYEENFQITFLDVNIKRINNGYTTDVFRKKSFNGTYLNWNSLTTVQYKTGLIHCLLDRGWKICSNFDLFHKEINKIKQILIKNDYPVNITNKAVDKYLNKKFMTPSNYKVRRNPVYLVLPYGGRKTEEVKIKIKRLMERYFSQFDSNFIFKTA